MDIRSQKDVRKKAHEIENKLNAMIEYLDGPKTQKRKGLAVPVPLSQSLPNFLQAAYTLAPELLQGGTLDLPPLPWMVDALIRLRDLAQVISGS
jgi:hypothetical protein